MTEEIMKKFSSWKLPTDISEKRAAFSRAYDMLDKMQSAYDFFCRTAEDFVNYVSEHRLDFPDKDLPYGNFEKFKDAALNGDFHILFVDTDGSREVYSVEEHKYRERINYD